MVFKKQSEFPYLKQYKAKFKVDNKTVFAYKGDIYSNHPLPPDIYVHEVCHLERQNKIGADEWEKKYLSDDNFRLAEELMAYRVQLRIVNKYTKDKNKQNEARVNCARALASGLYGGIISYEEAFKRLKIS